MIQMHLKKILRRILLVTSVTLLLSNCVTHYETSSQEEIHSVGSTNEIALYPLEVLQKRMSACVTQYAIALDNKNNISVNYEAKDRKVTYQSPDEDLRNYMKICAGEHYDGKSLDKGSITISSKGA